MLKRSLFFEKPCRLSMRNQQLIINLTGSETRQVPIEDIGFIVIENQQISVTIPCMNALVENNIAVIYCNDKHLPISMLMSLDGNHVQGE
ncbi:MAG: CRISPR-associated endonuclease Cas1, partial [Tannerellaceae bacterium]